MKVDLPKSNAKPLNEEKPPGVVSLNAQGKLYVDKTEVSNANLVSVLTNATEGDKARRVNIRGDKGLAYGKVIETMGEINEAGFSKIALESEPPHQN